MQLEEVGYLSKTHGVKGHMVLKQTHAFNFEEVKVVFIEAAGSKAPYFVTEFKEAGNNLIVGLEGIDAVEKARSLTGKAVFVEAKYIEEEEQDESWLGFEVIDKHHGSLGQVLGVSHNGGQLLVSVNYKGAEVILPLVDELIERIDVGAKKIWYNAPEGLIDVYLSESE